MTTLKSHRKNPNIANVFSQMGIVEELGSGTKKIFRYTPLYSNGKEPQIEEQDVYRITIPLDYHTQKLRKAGVLERVGGRKQGYWKIKDNR